MSTSTTSTLSISMTVSGGNLTRKHTLNVQLDFSNIDNNRILQWAADNRIIALQRVLRATSDEYLDGLKNKLSIHADACGGKIETNAERITKLISAGMPAALAKLAVENPTQFATVMAGIKS